MSHFKATNNCRVERYREAVRVVSPMRSVELLTSFTALGGHWRRIRTGDENVKELFVSFYVVRINPGEFFDQWAPRHSFSETAGLPSILQCHGAADNEGSLW